MLAQIVSSNIVQFAQQSLKIPDTIIIRIAECFDVQLIDYGFLEPEQRWRLRHFSGVSLARLNLHSGSYVLRLAFGVRRLPYIGEKFP